MTVVYNELIAANRADFNKIKSVTQSKVGDIDFTRFADRPAFLSNIPDCTIKCHMQALMHEMVHRKISTIDALKKQICQYCNKYYPNIHPIFSKSDKATFLAEPREKTEPATFTNKDLEDMIRVSNETIDPESYAKITDRHHKSTDYDEYAHMVTKSFLMTGAFDWKDWGLTNWGLAWNARDTYANNDKLSITWTTWDAPSEKIVRMIFDRVHVPMDYRWADFYGTCSSAEMIIADEFADSDFIGPHHYGHAKRDVAHLQFTIGQDKSLFEPKLWENEDALFPNIISDIIEPGTFLEEQFRSNWRNPEEPRYVPGSRLFGI